MEACQPWQASLLDATAFIGLTPMRELLVRYLLGELNSQEQEQLEAQLRDSPELRRELEYLQACLPGEDDEDVDRPASAEAPRGLAERTLGRVCGDEPCPEISHTPAEIAAAYEPPQGTPSWSLADLTVAGGVCLAISMLFLPALRQSRDAARRTSCANNLREVGTMLIHYAEAQGDYFLTPRGSENAGIFAVYLAEEGYAGPDELTRLLLCRASPLADQTGKDRITIRVPSMCELEAATAKQRCMWKRAMSPYYAYLLGFFEGGRHCAVRNQHSCRKAVLADAPCDKLGDMSANHGEGGANVFYQDGHVGFQKQRDLEASQRGKIYLNDAGQAAPGLDRDDTVLGRSEATPGNIVTISRPNQ